MAISLALLASTSVTTDAGEYNVPSANYDANALILAHIVNTGALPPVPTITGLTGATWETVETFTFNSTLAPTIRNSVLRTMIGTSQNAVVLTASFGALTQTGFAGIIHAVTGCATSDSNGAGAITQSTHFSTGGGQIISITLPSTPSQTVMGCYAKDVNTSMGTPAEGGFFVRATDVGYATPATRAMVARSQVPVQTWTSTQTANAAMAVIGMEFRVQSAGVTARGSRRLLAGVGI